MHVGKNCFVILVTPSERSRKFQHLIVGQPHLLTKSIRRAICICPVEPAVTASKRRHETAAVHEGCTRKKAHGLTVPVVYGPNHEVVGLSVVGLRTPLPKMRWVVYDPPIRVQLGGEPFEPTLVHLRN